MKKNGNRGEEIGQFEILRDILKKSSKRMRTLNFQAVYGTGGIKWCFEKFFSINLRNFKKEFELFKENIKKRHQILHGSLKDDEINKESVERFKASIDIFIAYLNSHISSLYMSRKSFDSTRLNRSCTSK